MKAINWAVLTVRISPSPTQPWFREDVEKFSATPLCSDARHYLCWPTIASRIQHISFSKRSMLKDFLSSSLFLPSSVPDSEKKSSFVQLGNRNQKGMWGVSLKMLQSLNHQSLRLVTAVSPRYQDMPLNKEIRVQELHVKDVEFSTDLIIYRLV